MLYRLSAGYAYLLVCLHEYVILIYVSKFRVLITQDFSSNRTIRFVFHKPARLSKIYEQ